MKQIGFVICVLLMAACSKDTGSKLYGKWQLQQTEIDGVVEKADTVYFNFEHSLFRYQIYVESSDSFIYRDGYNTVEGDSVQLELVGSMSSFLPYTDWSSSKRTFKIDELTSKRLVLSSDGKSYTFRYF